MHVSFVSMFVYGSVCKFMNCLGVGVYSIFLLILFHSVFLVFIGWYPLLNQRVYGNLLYLIFFITSIADLIPLYFLVS